MIGKPKTYTENEVVRILLSMKEEIADLEHEQWCHWTGHMILSWSLKNCRRWTKQIKTPYPKLSEKEKDSDRVWADKVIALIGSEFMTPSGFIKAIENSKLKDVEDTK